MISKKLIKQAKELSYSDAKKFGAPSLFHIDLSIEKGQELASKLNAKKEIVLLGTILMDCALGTAMNMGKLKKHIEMSAKKAKELLNRFAEVTNDEKEDILNCVRQHHGVNKFYSLESEICCNADCYRFLSVKGVIGGMKNSRDMTLDELIKLYLDKADEKWNTLTLDICKEELRPQYKAIREFLGICCIWF